MIAPAKNHSPSAQTTEEHFAKGLGLFSIGLGLAQIFAPREVARLIGAPSTNPLLMFGLGVREVMSGIGILSEKRPTGWVWSRVAGDMMDLGLLATAFAAPRANKDRLEAATLAVAGVAALDLVCALQLSSKQARNGHVRGQHVAKSIAINRSPDELYHFWRNFQNLPQFMKHLESVHIIDDTRSHWRAKGPAGTSVEWDAEIIADKPGEMIAWRSLPGAQVENAGSVHFEPSPGDRGTVVRVKIEYNPPAGALGATVAKLLGEAPEVQIPGDLLRFKQIMEIGRVTPAGGHPSRIDHGQARMGDLLSRR